MGQVHRDGPSDLGDPRTRASGIFHSRRAYIHRSCVAASKALAKLWRGIGDKVAVQSRPSASAWGRLASALIGSPFQIEFGNDDKYDRTQHIGETGIFRQTIHISVFNESLDDIPDCNIKLIAATPRPNTGDSQTIFQVHFRENFDLRSKQRKFIQIVSFAENPGNASILERDNIIISAASGGFFSGWTTIPIPSRDSPAILTLKAFPPGIASRAANLHIWVYQRRLHAQII
jgi:hypothetical protein